MAAGGFCKLPNGTVVVALNLPGAAADRPAGVRVLVHARNRARALTRLHNLGLGPIYLRGNAAPPTPDEVTAVLHHPDGLIWRTAPVAGVASAQELWHPIRALLRPPSPPAPRPRAALGESTRRASPATPAPGPALGGGTTFGTRPSRSAR